MEDETNGELERVQQQITLNLQEIDENFATCNQIVASRIMPEIERYGEAIANLCENTRTWLCFFKSVEQTFNNNNTTSTNRPPFSPQERIKATNSNHMHPILNTKDTTETRSVSRPYRSRLPPSSGSLQTNHIIGDIQKEYNNINNGKSETSTPSSINSQGALLDEFGNQIASPPRTTQFTPIRKSQTPIREGTSLVVDFEIKKIRDDLTESSEEAPSPISRRKEDKKLTGGGEGPVDTLNMDRDDPIQRARALSFFGDRQQRLKNMRENEELPRIRKGARSPSHRSVSRGYHFSPLDDLVSTPTVHRVLNDRERDLRHRYMMDSQSVASEDRDSLKLANSEEEEAAAYQFSEGLPEKVIADSPM
ncbi:hypothetical protein G6F57_012906 [Rhizopus arrhizus]|uniref:DASH complex subunit ASK1 n=1 Tax=Rhizopus oryzae TaxID=64495 RepID=A0A9P6WYB6_RHIOR|nr:hypothetical protein G6F23_010474 [Rhizopus arrhizus]KAG1400301.1 hypothetical protein G6F58_010972 [Rhizopus delemar]KAG0754749.1 hypothetical protein G6F24_012282 [Rhizopus arrhizus]KAG0777790.1 hypothetical protein G6F22_011633 [Rhizopus arrhizus]KAG0796114.1 hypothetical protein G6F21_001563 [Rhizopus arrhizus]